MNTEDYQKLCEFLKRRHGISWVIAHMSKPYERRTGTDDLVHAYVFKRGDSMRIKGHEVSLDLTDSGWWIVFLITDEEMESKGLNDFGPFETFDITYAAVRLVS